MAKLYVANTSRQTHDFHYRVPADAGWSKRVHIQTIAPGTQQQVYGEAPLPVLDAIIEQHRAYGILPAIEVVKTKDFVGLCYQFDEPIDFEKLSYAVDHNQGVLFDRGVRLRQEGAVAFDAAVERNLAEAQAHGELRGSATLKAVSVETLEDADAPTFAEGVKVDHLAPIEGGRRRA